MGPLQSVFTGLKQSPQLPLWISTISSKLFTEMLLLMVVSNGLLLSLELNSEDSSY